MGKQTVGIVAECVCDLPKSYMKKLNVDILYFLIETDSGVFTDTDEITAENIIGYMEAGGKKSKSTAPPPETYRQVFERNLEKYDDVIHIAISSGISLSCKYSGEAAAQMGEKGKRIHIFDTQHLSTGIAHFVIKAAEMAEKGCSAEEILNELTKLRQKVSSSFITVNADYLYRSGRVSENVKKICDIFSVHPILTMKNGIIALKSVTFGNYEKAALRYVRKELKKSGKINKRLIFVTHVGCSLKMLDKIKSKVNEKCRAETLMITKASATISSSCGPNTFGLLFVRED